jgi:integrase
VIISERTSRDSVAEALAPCRWAPTRNRGLPVQFFNHAIDHELIARNVFARLGAIKRIRRIDRPDFKIIADEQYQRPQDCARASRTDSYGLILQGVILTIGEAALGPGEIFALQHSDADFAAGTLHVRRQLDLDTGVIQWPKGDAPRDIVMSPALRGHLKIMPGLSEEILFPTPRGPTVTLKTIKNPANRGVSDAAGLSLQSGRPDLNRRPPAPKAGALPGCATPR